MPCVGCHMQRELACLAASRPEVRACAQEEPDDVGVAGTRSEVQRLHILLGPRPCPRGGGPAVAGEAQQQLQDRPVAVDGGPVAHLQAALPDLTHGRRGGVLTQAGEVGAQALHVAVSLDQRERRIRTLCTEGNAPIVQVASPVEEASGHHDCTSGAHDTTPRCTRRRGTAREQGACVRAPMTEDVELLPWRPIARVDQPPHFQTVDLCLPSLCVGVNAVG
mmetsp:Transcript_152647/g.489555  ORF Transcript_152647/g.489555 Transcript_152647/m.489555 type:complete len:221 (+) Transcript_152647:105-767(+)